MNFKPGDKVVILNSSKGELIGKSAQVLNILSADVVCIIAEHSLEERNFHKSLLHYYDVYHSPLFAALREKK